MTREAFMGLSQILRVTGYNRSEYDNEHWEWMTSAFDSGCNLSQVLLFANPHLTMNQVLEISTGLCSSGLLVSQVVVYAKPEFNAKQMEQIRRGFEYGLTIDQVSSYANPEIKAADMATLRSNLLNA